MNFSLLSCLVGFAAISLVYAAEGDECNNDKPCGAGFICCRRPRGRRDMMDDPAGGMFVWGNNGGNEGFPGRGSFGGRKPFGGEGPSDGQGPFGGPWKFDRQRPFGRPGKERRPPPPPMNGECVSSTQDSNCTLCLEVPPMRISTTARPSTVVPTSDSSSTDSSSSDGASPDDGPMFAQIFGFPPGMGRPPMRRRPPMGRPPKPRMSWVCGDNLTCNVEKKCVPKSDASSTTTGVPSTSE